MENYSCVGPHENKLAKRAIGRINAHVDFGMGCSYGPHFDFKGEDWVLTIYAYDEGWFVHFPFGSQYKSDQLYYEKLMDLYEDLKELGAFQDSRFSNSGLQTFWLLAYWDQQGKRPQTPDDVYKLADTQWRGCEGPEGIEN